MRTLEPQRDEHQAEYCPVRGKHDKLGRQAALLEAATEEFAEHGFDAATTRDIAERAGCSEGLIHRYFGGKQGLLLAVLDERAENLIDIYNARFPETDNVEEDIRQAIRLNLETSWEKRAGMRIHISRAAIDRDVGLKIRDLFNDVRVELLRRRLLSHRAAGRVDPDADIDAVAQGITACGFAMSFFGQVVFEMDRERVAHDADAFAHVIARGIAPAGRESGAISTPRLERDEA
jgi:TetR/AcrR family transcriptional regulator, regulator of cefoperazone and chloramphenicol sensitivity